MSDIYIPSEDSFFMSKFLSKELKKILINKPNIKFLEIGAGSGINLKTALSSGVLKKNIFSSDINTKAVNNCISLGFNCVNSNLFKNIPKNKFDAIVFNPPYLPIDPLEPKSSRLETTGGKNGSELSIKFLKQAKDYLSKSGKIFLITSSLSKKINFENLGYKSKLIEREKIFFEELYLWELQSKSV